MSLVDRYNTRADAANSLLCVGLDSDRAKLPAQFSGSKTPQFDFNRAIIDATHEFAAAYKANIAFYEARGEQGIHELKLTMEYLAEHHPDVATICDAKRADIGNTNTGYVEELFDWFGFDAVTLHPYLGREALQPFLARADKGCIILCRTSNPGAREFQDLLVSSDTSTLSSSKGSSAKPLWQHVAEHVSNEWNTNGNCLLVVGATYPDEMKRVRELSGEMTFLVPGIGAQGGDVEAVVTAGLNSEKRGMIINSSRGIIFASTGEDFAEAAAREAETLRDEINRYR